MNSTHVGPDPVRAALTGGVGSGASRVTFPHRVSQWKGWVWILGAVLAGCALPTLLAPGPMLSVDWPVWWSIANDLQSEIVPHQRWFWGVLWQNGNGGVTVGSMYSAPLIAPWLLGTIFSATLSLKIIFALSMYAVAICGYTVARNMSLSRLLSCVVGLLILERNNTLINDGMWYNAVSEGLALVFLVQLHKLVNHGRLRNWAFGCLLMAVIELCHPLGVVMGASFWLAAVGYAVALHRRDSRQARVLTLLLLLPVTSILLASPQFLAQVQASGSDSGSTTASVTGALTPLHFGTVDGTLLGLLILGLPGAVHLWRRDRLAAWMLAAGVTICALFRYHGFGTFSPGMPFVRELSTYSGRFHFVLGTLLSVFVGCTIGVTVHALMGRGRLLPVMTQVATMALFAVLSVTVVAAAPRSTLGSYDSDGTLQRLLDWSTRTVGTSGARIYFEDTYPAVELETRGAFGRLRKGRTHLFALAAGSGPVAQVNGLWGNLSPFDELYCSNASGLLGVSLEDLDEKGARTKLRVLNCAYIVAFSDPAKHKLSGFEFLDELVAFGKFTVFKVSGFVPSSAWVDDETNRTLGTQRISPTELRVEADGASISSVIVSMAWSAQWSAHAGAEPLLVTPDRGLLRIDLGRRAPSDIVLRYQVQRAPGLIGALVGCLSFVLIMLVCRPRRVANPVGMVSAGDEYRLPGAG